MTRQTRCEYGNHKVDMHPATLYCYTDLKHGIPNDTQTCPACYLEHLRRYYPGSPIIQHVIDMHMELAEPRKPEPVQGTFFAPV